MYLQPPILQPEKVHQESEPPDFLFDEGLGKRYYACVRSESLSFTDLAASVLIVGAGLPLKENA
jgi:hypothetical protein